VQSKKHTSVVTAGTPEAIRHSLHDGVTAYFVLSPVTGLFVTVVVAMRSIVDNLTPASGVRTTRLHRPKIARSSSAQTSAIASRAQRP
jgi:hypothetical protein